MTPYNDDLFRELQEVLARAEPAQLEKLLNDLANGSFSQTAQTRAGGNDDRHNVTDMIARTAVRAVASGFARSATPLSNAARDVRRKRYSS